ncbi:YIP1 family protein, partial [Elizabethkingia miricola]
VYTFQSIIFNTLICNLVGIITLLILGKFINKNTRVIDVVNTILISQIPYILVIPLTQLSFIHNASNNVIKTVGKIPKQIPPLGDLIIITFFGTFLLSIIIYSYILLFKGFKTACNMKKRLHVILFIISVILFTLIYSTSYYEK